MSSNENERKRVYELTQGHCFYCGCKLDFDAFELEHFIAESKGGGNSGNRVPACSDCNRIKGNNGLDEFRGILNGYKTEDIQVRLMEKYRDVMEKKGGVVFYFEENGLSPI